MLCPDVIARRNSPTSPDTSLVELFPSSSLTVTPRAAASLRRVCGLVEVRTPCSMRATVSTPDGGTLGETFLGQIARLSEAREILRKRLHLCLPAATHGDNVTTTCAHRHRTVP